MGFSVGNLRVALLRAGLEYSEEVEPKETANFVVFITESLLKNIQISVLFCRLVR